MPPAPALQVVRVPVLSDNYAWLVHDPPSGETAVVDPGEADPVLAAAGARGWTISQVWNTHWHPDHTGGNAALAAAGATVTGPAAEAARIPALTRGIGAGDEVELGAHRGLAIATPGHTMGHLCLHFPGVGPDADLLFTGDALFAMGIGRLFEGTAEDAYAGLRRLDAVLDDTIVYCGHEYTAANARFALTVEPGNAALVERAAVVEATRARGEPTVPFPLGLDRATNPFLRARDAAELAERRAAKDRFAG